MIYFCATPIGNIEDISLRAIETLKSVDIIACEDTRVSLKLLNKYDIKKKLISYHKFNEVQVSEEIIKLARENDIAIISDAGMPVISDPGEVLIKKLIEEEIEFTVVPGANAGLSALLLSGLDSEHFLFYGFLEQKASARKKELESLKDFPFTLIFYESPHRVKSMLEDLLDIFGNRQISVSREITKLFEETKRGKVREILDSEIKEKGEFVIVVDKAEEKEEVNIQEILRDRINSGMKKSQAVKKVAKEYNISKNELYKMSLEVQDE